VNAETGGRLADSVWAAVSEFVDRAAVRKYGDGFLDRSRSDRIVVPAVERILADRDAALARAREAIRVEMLAQPMTDGRDTYGDGYQQGLARAIDRIDAALVPVPGPGAKS
jgi:hypothetical protein